MRGRFFNFFASPHQNELTAAIGQFPSIGGLILASSVVFGATIDSDKERHGALSAALLAIALFTINAIYKHHRYTKPLNESLLDCKTLNNVNEALLLKNDADLAISQRYQEILRVLQRENIFTPNGTFTDNATNQIEKIVQKYVKKPSKWENVGRFATGTVDVSLATASMLGLIFVAFVIPMIWYKKEDSEDLSTTAKVVGFTLAAYALIVAICQDVKNYDDLNASRKKVNTQINRLITNTQNDASLAPKLRNTFLQWKQNHPAQNHPAPANQNQFSQNNQLAPANQNNRSSV